MGGVKESVMEGAGQEVRRGRSWCGRLTPLMMFPVTSAKYSTSRRPWQAITSGWKIEKLIVHFPLSSLSPSRSPALPPSLPPSSLPTSLPPTHPPSLSLVCESVCTHTTNGHVQCANPRRDVFQLFTEVQFEDHRLHSNGITACNKEAIKWLME